MKRLGLNERDIISAATLPELDDAYTRYAGRAVFISGTFNRRGLFEFQEGVSLQDGRGHVLLEQQRELP